MRIEYHPEDVYPVKFVDYEADIVGDNIVFFVDEAELLRDRLNAIITEDADRNVVQVKFDGSGRTYAYRDPSGRLAVGDRVVVDTNYGGEQEVTVVGRGRGGYDGGLRAVIAKVVTERIEL